MHFTKMGTVVYLLSLALSRMTGWDIYLVIVVVSLATLLYTLIGGIEAVVWTDVVQGFLFLAGGLLCILILLFRPEGGPAAVVGLAWKNGKIDLGLQASQHDAGCIQPGRAVRHRLRGQPFLHARGAGAQPDDLQPV